MPADLSQLALSPADLDELRRLVSLGKSMQPDIARAARQRGTSGTLSERVAARCEFALMGIKLQSVTGSPLLAPGISKAQTPPAVGGMMHAVGQLGKIVEVDYGREPGSADFAMLAKHLKRVRHLLRVYYDFRVARRQHADLVYCDWGAMSDVGITLHRLGLLLQLDPSRLRAAMARGGPQLEQLLLEDDMDIGSFRKMAVAIRQRVVADVEAEDSDREIAGELEDKADGDLAAHVLSWFYGDVTVGFIIMGRTSGDAAEKRWASKAMKRLVLWSTHPTYRATLGDALTDAMRPIYWSKPLLTEFGQAGGLAALFGDWINSSCASVCEEALKTLPSAAWENQKPASLLAITRELQGKISHETTDIACSVIFINACLNMYSLYGLAPFVQASKKETDDDPVLFYYIQHVIKRDKLPMETAAEWEKLLKSYAEMPRTMEKRYQWANYSIGAKWDCLEFFGCEADGCPEQRALFALRDERVRGVRDAQIEERLEKWGTKPRSCAACESVSYCSSSCQKAHWPTHKPQCLKFRRRA
ncbi:unnamed protein product [Mycena citricolor]|uniref:MYND-type domain-containing protein n=1 Tax=Mycena citricolor TaxID=2018698 RepID=A0AAD2HYU0_9AGAR|nr:unnamed protein product [Mycena citricolor]